VRRNLLEWLLEAFGGHMFSEVIEHLMWVLQQYHKVVLQHVHILTSGHIT